MSNGIGEQCRAVPSSSPSGSRRSSPSSSPSGSLALPSNECLKSFLEMMQKKSYFFLKHFKNAQKQELMPYFQKPETLS